MGAENRVMRTDGTDAPSELWLSHEDGDIHYVRVDLFSGTKDSDDDRAQMCIHCGERLVTAPDGCVVHADPDEDPSMVDYGWVKCKGRFTEAELDTSLNPCSGEPLTQRQETWRDIWTLSDCRFAKEQGWVLSKKPDGTLGIQRLTDPPDPCFRGDYEAAGFVLDRSMYGAGRSKEVAQKALRLVSSETELPAQPPGIERCLYLSTAHVPRPQPIFGDLQLLHLRAQEHKYGFIVFVMGHLEEDRWLVPEWLRPIYWKALETDALLIDFDADAPVSEEFPTYDWT